MDIESLNWVPVIGWTVLTLIMLNAWYKQKRMVPRWKQEVVYSEAMDHLEYFYPEMIGMVKHYSVKQKKTGYMVSIHYYPTTDIELRFARKVEVFVLDRGNGYACEVATK